MLRCFFSNRLELEDMKIKNDNFADLAHNLSVSYGPNQGFELAVPATHDSNLIIYKFTYPAAPIYN